MDELVPSIARSLHKAGPKAGRRPPSVEPKPDPLNPDALKE